MTCVAGASATLSDPFDHILIAQAKAEGLGFVTNDGPICGCPIQTIW